MKSIHSREDVAGSAAKRFILPMASSGPVPVLAAQRPQGRATEVLLGTPPRPALACRGVTRGYSVLPAPAFMNAIVL